MSARLSFTVIFGVCAALLGFGYYLQYARGLEPCPMCMMQRLCFIATALVALIGAIHGPRYWGRRVYGAGVALFAGTGGAIATRQIWLQHLPPDRVPECGPGWNYMVDAYPLAEVVRQALRGTGDCAEVAWTFLSLSIPEWSLGWFALIALAGLREAFRRCAGSQAGAAGPASVPAGGSA